MITSHSGLFAGPSGLRSVGASDKSRAIAGKLLNGEPEERDATGVFDIAEIPPQLAHLQLFDADTEDSASITDPLSRPATATSATNAAAAHATSPAVNNPAPKDNSCDETATAFRTTTTTSAASTIPSASPEATTPASLLRSVSLSAKAISQENTDNSNRISSVPPSTTGPSPRLRGSAIRKTSPGLAARLKALGFGASKKPDSPPPSAPPLDSVGRLNEYQLRQLDEKHQAGSFSSVISRRGRPWKGAGATSTSPARAADQLEQAQSSAAAESCAPASLQLPEIRTSEPLAMDTQKYRLPDHTNSNGTKVTLDVRQEHLERSFLPLAIEDDTLPPPSPPPKETPPIADAPTVTPPSSDYVPGLSSYFTPGHNRPGSIYTLSRASFANQLAQLTALQLPDAESLSSKVSAIRTAQVAAKALINAADQIRSWIAKALEVIGGLDSDDDVEWAAAGGREGLAEVETAISRFEELINAYVSAIEELQGRPDIGNVDTADLQRAVAQMETIISEWEKIRRTLQNVRGQVEIAMEWEELWNNVLGDIQGEMDELSRLVFEMEERRHKSIAAAAGGNDVDIGDLETIVEETPTHPRTQAQSRLSIAAFPMTPTSPGTSGLSQDDSSLLALFARMQPLRASLDFLPMRLSVFQNRADQSFPTACEELDERQAGLDASYKKLEKDAEVLRKELGEDRWVIVFRGAGRQAQKMHESVERSLLKLRESIDAGMHLTNPPMVAKKLESFEAKKTHYGPAIERVLSIIDRGVKDRLTVNGEILRLHTELQARWESLKSQMIQMDGLLEEIQAEQKGQQLRDSISSMLSNDQSTVASGHETPGSSPPSSVVMSSLGFDPHTPMAAHNKARSPGSGGKVPSAAGRRHSSLPAPTPQPGKKKPTASRLSTIPSSSVTTPLPPSRIRRPESSLGHRPAWNASTNTSKGDTGHHFKPLSATTPSPYTRSVPATQRSVSALTPSSGGSRLPTRSLARAASESPRGVEDTPSRPSHSRLSFRERLASPGPYAQQSLPKPRAPVQSSLSTLSSKLGTSRRVSLQPSAAGSVADEGRHSRPGSSLASSWRSSLLPQPRSKADAAQDSKPKWRG